jgi:hypothetical protein
MRDGGTSMEQSNQAAVDPSEPPKATRKRYVPPIDEAELARRNQAAMRLLDAWERDEEGEEEQRETLAVLKEALGERRIASYRNLFP